MTLEAYFDEIYQCVRCGYCQKAYLNDQYYDVCPYYELFGFESYSARGKIAIARAILEGKLEYNISLSDRVFRCLLCGSCIVHCPVNLNICGIVRAMREESYQKGFFPSKLKKIVSNIKEKGNIFGHAQNKKTDWSSDLELPTKENIMYFAGCFASFVRPEIARATIKIIKNAGIRIGYLGEKERCCGNLLFKSGLTDLAEKLVKHNVSALEKAGAEQVVFSCACGFHTFKTEYPRIIGGELPFKVMHTSQMFIDLISKGKIKFKENLDKTVTYHDPCNLGRYEKVYHAPRAIIEKIPKIKLIELPRNKENTRCCGGGAGVNRILFPEVSRKMASEKIKEAKKAGAKTIITSCPFCIENLAAQAKAEMDVNDLAVVMAKAIGIKV